MCDKCTEIDAKIAHFTELAARLSDAPTIEGIKKVIKEKLDQKALLHPEDKRKAAN
jgi:hypothetical protein